MQCNFGYFEHIYFDNERYYFTFQNTLFYSTINSNECLRAYEDGKAKIIFNQYNWRVIGKILHNGIKSIDLPIIKPIKFI